MRHSREWVRLFTHPLLGSKRPFYGITVTDDGVNGIAEATLPVFCCPRPLSSASIPARVTGCLMDFSRPCGAR